jgi:hypothetical protein
MRNDVKKKPSVGELNLFNQIYIEISIKVMKSLINNTIRFDNISKQFSFQSGN